MRRDQQTAVAWKRRGRTMQIRMQMRAMEATEVLLVGVSASGSKHLVIVV